MPGIDSTFFFDLPLPLHRPTHEVPDSSIDLSDLRVLIIQRQAKLREVLSEQLSQWDIRSTDLASVPKALDVMRAAQHDGDPYHIALVTDHMVGFDAETFGRTIKETGVLRGTYLVMLASVGIRRDA